MSRGTCTCDCWDGRLKGCYERHSYIGKEYRSLYFNLTPEMLEIFIMSVIFFVVLTHVLKDMLYTALTARHEIRWSMLVALIATIIPEFYAYWAHLNYINDGLYYLRTTQLWFTLTETANSLIFFTLLDRRRPIPTRWITIMLWASISVSMSHIMISSRNLIGFGVCCFC